MAAKKKSTANGAAAPATPRVKRQLHVEGFPADEDGHMIEGASVPLDVARRIPLDAPSSRSRQQRADVLRRKANGEKNVELPGDPVEKFQLLKDLHPGAQVSFRKFEPEQDDGIPPRPLSMFANYDMMVKYLREGHYDGRASSYEWTVRDNAYRLWGKGLVQLGERAAQPPQLEEEEDDMRRGQPPQYGPQQYPPQGYYPNPAYPQQHPYPPPPGYYYPPQPVPTPAPAPSPEMLGFSPAELVRMTMEGQRMGMPPEVLGQFLQMFERLSQNNATLAEQIRQQRQAPAPAPVPVPIPYQQPPPDPNQGLMPYMMKMMEMLMQAGKEPPPPPVVVPPPPPPPDPLQQMENGLGMLAKFGTLQNKLARQFAPTQPQLNENPIPDTSPDETPYALHDMGMFRAVMAKPGGPEPTTIEKFALNGDKIGSFVEMVLDKVMTKREANQQTQVVDTETVQIREKAAAIREAAEQTERVLAARRALAQTPAPGPQPTPEQPPQLNPQFVRVIDVPPLPEPVVVATPSPPPPAPAPMPEVVPLALRMMMRKPSVPVAPIEPESEFVPLPDDEVLEEETVQAQAPEETVADTEPPPPPVVADAN